MPSRRRRQVELERVLGTPALFATAYGNVGSSIYYALGVTAVFALGLTPLVFVVAGVLHFVRPGMYEAIMPDYLPAHRELVYASGVAEIAGGLGVMHPRARRAARQHAPRRRCGRRPDVDCLAPGGANASHQN